MKEFILIAFQLLTITSFTFSQKLITFKDHCGYYYKSMDDLLKQKGKELAFYKFKAQQTVASIGAQCCNWEAAFAAATDSVHFYLEDIDSTYFNRRQADFAWNYYSNLRQKPMSSTYKIVLGSETNTNLSDSLFDKILIINSFHEFTFKKEMLADISSKLKPDGVLYIDETLARHTGQLHGVCKKRIYLDKELVAILNDSGYKYINGVEMNFRKSKPVRKIFAFKKMAD